MSGNYLAITISFQSIKVLFKPFFLIRTVQPHHESRNIAIIPSSLSCLIVASKNESILIDSVLPSDASFSRGLYITFPLSINSQDGLSHAETGVIVSHSHCKKYLICYPLFELCETQAGNFHLMDIAQIYY